MRTHLGCTGSVDVGPLGKDSQKRFEQIAATWLEYSPDASSLVVRHVQPDNLPALRELAGELLDFLHVMRDSERVKIPGGAFFYQDESTGHYVRLKVWAGGFLTIAWARPDYTRAQWIPFLNQRVNLVFEPYQRLNGAVGFEGQPDAAVGLRKIIDKTSGEYSQGDYEIVSSVGRVEVTIRDVNADALSIVNALRYMARSGTLSGELEVTSFRAGDMDDYCRFSFRCGEIWMARPVLWTDTPDLEPTTTDCVAGVA